MSLLLGVVFGVLHLIFFTYNMSSISLSLSYFHLFSLSTLLSLSHTHTLSHTFSLSLSLFLSFLSLFLSLLFSSMSSAMNSPTTTTRDADNGDFEKICSENPPKSSSSFDMQSRSLSFFSHTYSRTNTYSDSLSFLLFAKLTYSLTLLSSSLSLLFLCSCAIVLPVLSLALCRISRRERRVFLLSLRRTSPKLDAKGIRLKFACMCAHLNACT